MVQLSKTKTTTTNNTISLSVFPNNTRTQRFTIDYNSSQNKREGVSIKPIFKAPLNKPVFLLFLLHDQEVMKKNYTGGIKNLAHIVDLKKKDV